MSAEWDDVRAATGLQKEHPGLPMGNALGIIAESRELVALHKAGKSVLADAPQIELAEIRYFCQWLQFAANVHLGIELTKALPRGVDADNFVGIHYVAKLVGDPNEDRTSLRTEIPIKIDFQSAYNQYLRAIVSGSDRLTAFQSSVTQLVSGPGWEQGSTLPEVAAELAGRFSAEDLKRANETQQTLRAAGYPPVDRSSVQLERLNEYDPTNASSRSEFSPTADDIYDLAFSKNTLQDPEIQRAIALTLAERALEKIRASGAPLSAHLAGGAAMAEVLRSEKEAIEQRETLARMELPFGLKAVVLEDAEASVAKLAFFKQCLADHKGWVRDTMVR